MAPRTSSVSGMAASTVASHTPDENGRRAPHALDAGAAGRKRAHAKNAHDSSASCSHTSHFSDHLVAAAEARGSSVFELFV